MYCTFNHDSDSYHVK